MSASAVVGEVQPTLDELGGTAAREHGLVVQAGTAMIEHAIRAGEALLAARDQYCGPLLQDRSLSQNQVWMAWLAENFPGARNTASGYMRVASHQDAIRSALRDPTLGEALRYIRGLQPSLGGVRVTPQEVIDEARRLRGQGLAFTEIAPLLGISAATVRRHLDPAARRRYCETNRRKKQRERMAAKVAARATRDRAVREKGGTLAESYSRLRRTEQEVDSARFAATNREIRVTLNAVLTSLHEAEDHLVRALGIEVT